jgi:phytoene desaturase
MRDRVVVVGGGLGGLSAAIHLAAAGRPVTVLERRAEVGGKASEICEAGYRWDTGPTVITLQPVLAELFAAAGRRIEDYLTLVPVDPLTRYFGPQGRVLDISASLARTVAQIDALDGRDVEGYLRFLAYAARMHRIVAPVALYGDPPTLRSVLRVPLRDMVRVDFLRTMHGAIRAHVRSPLLQRILGRFATYLGASPYVARAFLNVIAHVELTAGLWYPLGGTVSITRAYRRLAQELGVEIRTSTPVSRIVVASREDRGREDGLAVVGVALEDGSIEQAAAVVCNVDATRAYHDLLPPEVATPRRVGRLARGPFSCSGFVLLLGVEGQYPQLAHHNILFSSDYRREFARIFRDRLPPQEPTVYVAITSKSDPSHAPPGCENWYVMVNVPPLGPGWDWEQEARGYREVVLARLASFGLDVRGRVRAERMLTPIELEEMTGAWHGALYGRSFNNPLAPFLRPHNRAPGVRGLYLTGGTTHPGGGVPLVTMSGRTAAQMVLRDAASGETGASAVR